MGRCLCILFAAKPGQQGERVLLDAHLLRKGGAGEWRQTSRENGRLLPVRQRHARLLDGLLLQPP